MWEGHDAAADSGLAGPASGVGVVGQPKVQGLQNGQLLIPEATSVLIAFLGDFLRTDPGKVELLTILPPMGRRYEIMFSSGTYPFSSGTYPCLVQEHTPLRSCSITSGVYVC